MADIIKVFNFQDYKLFIHKILAQMPKAGHGQFLKIAKQLNIHTTMVTHVLKGHLHFSPEQSLALCEYLGLNEFETEYFLNLVHFARSGDERTKKFYEKKLEELKEKSQNIGTRIQAQNILSEEEQAIFYSEWTYTAIRLLSAIPQFQTRNALADRIRLPLAKTNRIIDFLLGHGLCVEKENRITYGPVKTFVGQSSPLVGRHHKNWRLKALEQIDRLESQELAYTSPVVVSAEDFQKIREKILILIEEIKKISEPSPSENLYCLNIDWLEVK